MSVENAKQFLNKLDQDPSFKKSLQNITREEGKKILQKQGLRFTQDEFIEAYNEVKGGELQEKELAQIAGGTLPGAPAGVSLGFTE